jgi:hypothetical protein
MIVPPSSHETEEAEIYILEQLSTQGPNFNHRRIFKPVPRWDKRINVLGGLC